MSNNKVIAELDKALFAHGAWKMKLRSAISKGSSDITPETASRDDCCAFGKWLHGAEIDARVRGSVHHQSAVRLHRDFHQSAGRVLEQALRDNRDGAISLLKGEFGDRSQTLIIELTQWKRDLSKSEAA